jgi:hypothetical protein
MSSAAIANSSGGAFFGNASEVPDLLQAVADALNLPSGRIVIGNEKCVWDQRSIKFMGYADGQEFFAKMLIADPYPVNIAAPWHSVLIAGERKRCSVNQVKLEASVRYELALMTDVSAIPECLGSSALFRTVVWERLSGTTALSLLRRSGMFDPLGKTCRAIALKAGSWLRRLHDDTRRGAQDLSLSGAMRAVQQTIPSSNRSASARCANDLLSRSAEKMSGSVAVPVSRNHGDFTLVNLMWNQEQRELHVIDFENSEYAPIWQDLAAISFSMRKQLLNPLIPAHIVRGMEQAFWKGYGKIDSDLFEFVQTLALSKILVHCPERQMKSGAGKMSVSGIAGSFYANLVQSSLMSRAVPELIN